MRILAWLIAALVSLVEWLTPTPLWRRFWQWLERRFEK